MKTHLNRLKKMISSLLLCSVLLMTLSGCGKDAELENYKANMNQFFTNVQIYHDAINAIDPEADTATTELLALLDSMNTTFAQMATLTVPEGFPGVSELAGQASEYMAEAVSYYHQAYEAEPYDPELESIASQNYERANLRFQYIVSILHGDIPEEIYTDEEE